MTANRLDSHPRGRRAIRWLLALAVGLHLGMLSGAGTHGHAPPAELPDTAHLGTGAESVGATGTVSDGHPGSATRALAASTSGSPPPVPHGDDHLMLVSCLAVLGVSALAGACLRRWRFEPTPGPHRGVVAPRCRARAQRSLRAVGPGRFRVDAGICLLI